MVLTGREERDAGRRVGSSPAGMWCPGRLALELGRWWLGGRDGEEPRGPPASQLGPEAQTRGGVPLAGRVLGQASPGGSLQLRLLPVPKGLE